MTSSEQTSSGEAGQDLTADSAAEGPAATNTGSAEAESLRAELGEYKDKLLRAQAECANVAKRWEQQHREGLKYSGMSLARDLLGVLDGFHRTLATIDPKQADDPHIEGVRLVAQQFEKVLRDHGVMRIESVGKAFDPSLHEALMQDVRSEAPPGTVVSEFEPGYRVHDRVLRHAKVVVSGRPSEAGAPSDGDGDATGERAE